MVDTRVLLAWLTDNLCSSISGLMYDGEVLHKATPGLNKGCDRRCEIVPRDVMTL